MAKGPTKRNILDCWEQSGGICHLCRNQINGATEKWEAEHIIPRALGGSNKWPNLQPACKRCHEEKTKKDVKVISKAVRQAERNLGIERPNRQRIPVREKVAASERKPALPPRQLYEEK